MHAATGDGRGAGAAGSERDECAGQMKLGAGRDMGPVGLGHRLPFEQRVLEGQVGASNLAALSVP